MTKAPIHQKLLNHVRHRGGNGIALASDYLEGLARDIGKEAAAASWGHKSFGAAHKSAKSQLTYHHPSYEFKSLGEDGQSEMPEAAIAEVESIVSTVSKDWDGDIVRSDGLIFDAAGPLLRGHEQNSVFGKHAGVVSQNAEQAICKFYLADISLARDSLALMRIGALRKSIGFKALEAEPLGFKDAGGKRVATGFDIKRAVVMETSGVAIPANPTAEILSVYEKQYDAVRSLASKGGLVDPVMKIWGAKVLETRPVVVKGATLEIDDDSDDLLEFVEEEQPGESAAVTKSAGKQVPIVKDASPDSVKSVHWGMGEHMPGSYEQRIAAIDEGIKRYLCREEPSDCTDSHYAYVMATYETTVLVCMRRWRDGGVDKKCYQVEYTMDDDGKAVFSSHKHVSVEPQVLEIAEAKALARELETKGDTPDDLKRILAKTAVGEIDARGLVDEMRDTASLVEKSARADALADLFSVPAE